MSARACPDKKSTRARTGPTHAIFTSRVRRSPMHVMTSRAHVPQVHAPDHLDPARPVSRPDPRIHAPDLSLDRRREPSNTAPVKKSGSSQGSPSTISAAGIRMIFQDSTSAVLFFSLQFFGNFWKLQETGNRIEAKLIEELFQKNSSRSFRSSPVSEF